MEPALSVAEQGNAMVRSPECERSFFSNDERFVTELPSIELIQGFGSVCAAALKLSCHEAKIAQKPTCDHGGNGFIDRQVHV